MTSYELPTPGNMDWVDGTDPRFINWRPSTWHPPLLSAVLGELPIWRDPAPGVAQESRGLYPRPDADRVAREMLATGYTEIRISQHRNDPRLFEVWGMPFGTNPNVIGYMVDGCTFCISCYGKMSADYRQRTSGTLGTGAAGRFTCEQCAGPIGAPVEVPDPLDALTSTRVECIGGCGYSWVTWESPVIHTICEDCADGRVRCRQCDRPMLFCTCPDCPCGDLIYDPSRAVIAGPDPAREWRLITGDLWTRKSSVTGEWQYERFCPVCFGTLASCTCPAPVEVDDSPGFDSELNDRMIAGFVEAGPALCSAISKLCAEVASKSQNMDPARSGWIRLTSTSEYWHRETSTGEWEYARFCPVCLGTLESCVCPAPVGYCPDNTGMTCYGSGYCFPAQDAREIAPVSGTRYVYSNWDDTDRVSPDAGEIVSYSDLDRPEAWANNSRPVLTSLDLCAGSDYSGSSVERSNFEALLEEFPGEGPGKLGYVWELTGHPGAYGILVDLERLARDRRPMADSLREILRRLETYSVIDDELLSQVEMAREDETWEQCYARDFANGLAKNFDWLWFEDLDLLDPGSEDSSRLWELCRLLMDRENLYWVHETGDSCYLDVDRLISACTPDDIRAVGWDSEERRAVYLAELRLIDSNLSGGR